MYTSKATDNLFAINPLYPTSKEFKVSTADRPVPVNSSIGSPLNKLYPTNCPVPPEGTYPLKKF